MSVPRCPALQGRLPLLRLSHPSPRFTAAKRCRQSCRFISCRNYYLMPIQNFPGGLNSPLLWPRGETWDCLIHVFSEVT